MKKITLFVINFIMLACITMTANAQEKVLKSAWLNELEAFPLWYAIDNGMDKKAGYDFEIVSYPTGKRLVDSISSDDWTFGVAGLTPVLDAVLDSKAQIFAIGADETYTNKIITRANSPIMGIEGVNADFPKVYGSAETVRGKTILCPLNTNAHQLLLAWLEIIGLEDKDVNIIDVVPSEALRAFASGFGDIVILWSPSSLRAIELGFEVVATGADCNVVFKTVFFGKESKIAAAENDISVFMYIYFDALTQIQAMPFAEQVELFKELQTDYAVEKLHSDSIETLLTQQVLYNNENHTNVFKAQDRLYNNTFKNAIDFYTFINASPRRTTDYLNSLEYVKPIF